jgi:D-glycero-alpha-D-manno-heptose-7-phosphate kinase
MTGTTYRASAPVRLDFAGAWTDVAPFVERHRGEVVNAAIELRATAAVTPGTTAFRLHADDLDRHETSEGPDALDGDGALGLLKAALRASDVGPCELRTSSQAPPGSGLGSSGAMGVALVAAIDAATGVARTPAATAEAAWRVETLGAAIAGGRQDQYAAALGGFHHLECSGELVVPTPVVIDPPFADALAHHLVLCYTGKSRFSADTITRVMQAFDRGEPLVNRALHALAALGDRMVDALRGGDLATTGRLLQENWEHQLQLDAAMRTPEMAALESVMRDAGSLGGKAAGSGAGGSMFFIVRDPDAAAARARALGATVLPVQWAWQGIRVEAMPT